MAKSRFREVPRIEHMRQVAGEWEIQNGERIERYPDGDEATILNKLRALGDSPTKEDIDAIMDNGLWTNFVCDTCGDSTLDTLVEIKTGCDDDGVFGPNAPEEWPVYMCQRCLEDAAKIHAAKRRKKSNEAG